METVSGSGSHDTVPSLETSLVEWKRRTAPPRTDQSRPLGNFLSGMETRRGDGEQPGVDLPWKLP